MPIEILSHQSTVLSNNQANDPTDRHIWVVLPPDYATSNKRYPVVFFLAAFGSTGAELVVGNPWSPGMDARLTRMWGQGCPPFVAVFPDCFTRWGGSQYLNSPALGRYEDYVCDELVAWTDQNFRTIPRREARGVLGRSSGGYGALRLAIRRPDRFSAFACHSGDMGFAFCYLPDFAACADQLQRAGSLAKWVDRFDARTKMRPEFFTVANVLAMSAAYSPSVDQPFGLALPFEITTGEIVSSVWQQWRTQDPINMLGSAENVRALRSARLAYFDCGTRDEYHLHLGLQAFARALTERQVPHRADFFDDGHRSLSYRHEISVPEIASALLPAATG